MTPALLVDLVAEAWGTIRGNPLRAGLAALAIAAAVATMSLVVTGLDGIERSARQTTARAFGSDSFVLARVFPGQLGRRALIEKLRRNPDVTRSDVRFLDRHAGNEVRYAPLAQRNADVVSGGRRFENASIVGTASALADLRDLGVERGRFFSVQEEVQAAQVAVVGADVADAIFPGADPLGRTVRVGLRGFLVVGVQGRQGAGGGASLDRNVWIPLAAWERIFGAPSGLQVFARGVGTTGFAEAEDRARATMRARRALGPGVEDNFELLAPEAARTFVQNISTRISAAGVPISIMAMLAAIVVVTNTILVSVTQRTREIGIRRAIGGSRLHVTVEIVAESAIVALAGGLAGVIGAGGLLALASRAAGLDLPLQPATVAVSLGAAIASGMLAAWYPARRASRIDVVAALHQE